MNCNAVKIVEDTEKKIKMWSRGSRKEKKWFASLIQCEDVGEKGENH